MLAVVCWNEQFTLKVKPAVPFYWCVLAAQTARTHKRLQDSGFLTHSFNGPVERGMNDSRLVTSLQNAIIHES